MKNRKLFENIETAPKDEKVECLGLTFESDEARREYFREKLREKLKDPEFRKIEGFPIGEDEDIIKLSDPPYYTACPNPFISDFIKHYGKPYNPEEKYSREPFAADVSEGKNDPIYNAHSYHTKVPHKAIMRYILHYTEPGDIVFDGFCGTGMTGVAAQMCGDKKTVESLGYTVLEDGKILDENGKAFSKLGARYAILNDLSPAATFIAYNYNTPIDAEAFEREAKRILEEVEAECGWMYLTLHNPTPDQIQKAVEMLKTKGKGFKEDNILPWGKINYTVWSDVFTCPECSGEVVFWEAAVDKDQGKVLTEFQCPHCGATLVKRKLERVMETKYDKAIGQTIKQAKQMPVLINYTFRKKRFEKTPDDFDLALIEHIETSDIPYWYPTNRVPKGDKTGDPLKLGITHVHHFYTKRNLWVLASIFSKISSPEFLLLFNSQLINISKLNRYRPGVSFPYNPLSGTLYIGSQVSESSVFTAYRNKIKKLQKAFSEIKEINIVNVSSAENQQLSEVSVDYIFTDPPFGGNLMYSELNFLWEAWLKVFTNNKPEAIINKVQRKGLLEYQELMTRCFKEYYRVLKPGRWMTVEFHNSQNSVWNAIQEAIQRAGFVIADVSTLDKHQGTFNQVTSSGAVKQDLIISAYKPNGGLEERFELEAGTEEGVWDFVREHLKRLPVFVEKNGSAEIIVERTDYLLYDRMVAFHIQRGKRVPLSAAEFYKGLRERFPERDGMFFLPDQVTEYDSKRIKVNELRQISMFVTDEESAIQWLRLQLQNKPQTFQELQPQFMPISRSWAKHEKEMELSELLEQNFLKYDGIGLIPQQIWSWMLKSSTLRERMEGQTPETADAFLREKAKDRWYVPDPNRAQDLERLREKTLLREFEEYKKHQGRKLRVFRTEAVRAGFKKAWSEKDYKTIIEVADKLPDKIIQEDPKLLMYYDNACTRLGEE
ncbi:DNA methylase [Kosmotoga arenicorallina S304]|uniref:DNA methylase n=1 Tax=Kosmotoga arenicorallina S304 TaxID=1453497 RepID=A0A176K116_9BACT|nr:DNA methyltransferase [Kosmotoga arenicorallina]OAA30192.1 DNA methylase [Kosmotoga arenicorallina S304]